MKYYYENGTIRWRRFIGKGDVRAYCCPQGWRACVDLIEYHPITGDHLGSSQWWIREEACHG